MKQNLITDVIQGMLPYLNNAQTERLQEVLQHTLFDYEVTKTEKDKELSEQNLVESFLSAKRIEGCSEKTLKYYNATIQSMLDGIGKGIKYIVTDDIRSLDADKIRFPLFLRPVAEGDRLIPFGMKGFKLVSDYLTDRKRSLFEKRRQLVLADAQGQILWLVGERTDNRYRIGGETKTVAVIDFLSSPTASRS